MYCLENNRYDKKSVARQIALILETTGRGIVFYTATIRLSALRVQDSPVDILQTVSGPDKKRVERHQEKRYEIRI